MLVLSYASYYKDPHTSFAASINDISSSAVFLSSSTSFGPETTTIHRLRLAILNTEERCCNEKGQLWASN